MHITRSLQKWGNGKAVRLPQAVVDAANIQLDQPLEITMRGRSIILTPLPEKPRTTLESMLRGVTPISVGGEQEWGSDIGVERYE